MKKIKYQLFCKQAKTVFDDDGIPSTIQEDVLSDIETVYSESEYERIKLIAYNGEVTVEEVPDPETPTADESVWDELDKAYQEGVNTAYDE